MAFATRVPRRCSQAAAYRMPCVCLVHALCLSCGSDPHGRHKACTRQQHRSNKADGRRAVRVVVARGLGAVPQTTAAHATLGATGRSPIPENRNKWLVMRVMRVFHLSCGTSQAGDRCYGLGCEAPARTFADVWAATPQPHGCPIHQYLLEFTCSTTIHYRTDGHGSP